MPHTNTFFSNTTGYQAEQELVDDLVIEQIAMFGIDVQYMPRRMLNLDKLLHEATKSVFDLAMPMPVYVKSFSGYQNGMELLTKFGVRSSDEITLVMSRSQWETHYGPFIKSVSNKNAGREVTDFLNKLDGETAARPKEGDLIYFPFDDGIFEIKYVMFDQPFFQLGRGYVFEMQCEKFEYSGETFITTIEEIDDSMDVPDYYRAEVMLESGVYTFEKYETVKIYDVSRPAVGFDPVQFRLNKDSGVLGDVPHVTARVIEYIEPHSKLILADVSDNDPEQLDENLDQKISKMDKTYIIGDKSKSEAYTVSFKTREAAFDDSFTIEEEFSQISIKDPGDENPFGFV